MQSAFVVELVLSEQVFLAHASNLVHFIVFPVNAVHCDAVPE
jgi:hypothetical protein